MRVDVRPNPRGGWDAVGGRVDATYRHSKQGAILSAKDRVRAAGGGIVVIHQRNGKPETTVEVAGLGRVDTDRPTAGGPTKAELIEENRKLKLTKRMQRGMLKKQAADFKRLEKRVAVLEVRNREQGGKRGRYQVRMYAALHALHEIAGRPSTHWGGQWPVDWGVTRAQSAIKEDAIQEALDNGWVKGQDRLPTWLAHRLRVQREEGDG